MAAAIPGRARSGVREEELWRRLGEVNDPELDEPVTAMGFVERATVAADGGVEVDFRLPTYWCSPNFAYLMLEGIHAALSDLSWSPNYRVTLHDHMFADEVNRGMRAGRSFGQIFGELAGDLDLDGLRETFRGKAFQRRQESVMRGLRRAGVGDADVLAMSLAALDAFRFDGDDEAAMQKPRYREALLGRLPHHRPCDPAFLTWDGRPIAISGFAAYLAELRGVRVNMEFNGALCRGLKQARYKEVEVVDGDPTLVDFILDRVPERHCAAP